MNRLSKSKRPKLKLKMTKLEYIIMGLSILLIVMNWVIVIANLREPDVSDKRDIFIWPLLASITFFALSVAARFPHLWNYIHPITHENAERQYKNCQVCLGLTGLVVALISLFVELDEIASVKGAESIVWELLVWISAILLYVVTGYMIYKMNKLK